MICFRAVAARIRHLRRSTTTTTTTTTTDNDNNDDNSTYYDKIINQPTGS